MANSSGEVLNVLQGLGPASRLPFDAEKLKNIGWKVHKKECSTGGRQRTLLTFESPSGKRIKSGKEVAAILKEENLFDKVSLSEDDEHSTPYGPAEPPPKRARSTCEK